MVRNRDPDNAPGRGRLASANGKKGPPNPALCDAINNNSCQCSCGRKINSNLECNAISQLRLQNHPKDSDEPVTPSHRLKSNGNGPVVSFDVSALAKLLKKPPDEVIKLFHDQRSHLSKLISDSISDSQLNVLIQILGSKLCGKVSAQLVEFQKELIVILTNPVFLNALLKYTMGFVSGHSSNWNLGDSDPPYCSALKIFDHVFAYYVFLLRPEIRDSIKLHYSLLLENIRAVRFVLHNIQIKCKVIPHSETESHRTTFKTLEEQFHVFCSKISNKLRSSKVVQLPIQSLHIGKNVAAGSTSTSTISSASTTISPTTGTAGDPFGVEHLLHRVSTSMSTDAVITYINDRYDSFSKLTSKKNIDDRCLNALIQIIGYKICKQTFFKDIQLNLISVLTRDAFLSNLNHYTRKLLRNLVSNERAHPPCCSAVETIKHLYTFYNFILNSLNGKPQIKLKSNIESVFVLIQNCIQNDQNLQLLDTTFSALRRFQNLFQLLMKLTDAKLQEETVQTLPPVPASSKQPEKRIQKPSASNGLLYFENDSFVAQSSCSNRNLNGKYPPNLNSNGSMPIRRSVEEDETFASSDSDSEYEIDDNDTDWNNESALSFNYNFKLIEDVPTKMELSADIGPSLNAMPMKGSHSSALLYLKDVYRLLREDFVAPLREFFNTVQKKERGVYLGRTTSPNIHLRFYHGVHYDPGPNDELEPESRSCSLRFLSPTLTEEEWEENGWLLPESLVILSSDNFKTIYIATVARREEKSLAEGCLTVMWEGPRPPCLIGVTFLMAESEAYFQAYRYNLNALQVMAQPAPVLGPPVLDIPITPLFATYPMVKYIVDMSTEHVPPPKYLRHTPHLLNFSALMSSHNSEHYVQPLDLSSWPRPSEIELDEAQFAAFQSAVTQELSIIQGPPGTGKTYIGLQLLKLFLSNPEIITSPILIVCRTNHALDQFLEGLLSIMENLNLPLRRNLIRIGGGSKSDLLEEYVWRTWVLMNDLRRLSRSQPAEMPSQESSSSELRSMEREISDLRDLLEKLRQVNSVAEFARLAQNSRGLKDLLDPTSPIDSQSSVSSFVTLGERHVLEQIAVLNVSVSILRDQAKFHVNEATQLNAHTGKVIGMTTTGAAKYTKWVRCLQPKIVIVEEAAEVLESHVVTSITEYCEHLILIGDHKQLRPFTQVHRLAREFHLDISLFERLIHNDHSWCCLETQHRMRPEICRLLVPTIYRKLENHPDVMKYPNVAGFLKNLFFINHEEHEQVDEGCVSKINEYEAHYAAALCRHLVLQDYDPSQVTILITYNGQKSLVTQLIKALGEPFSEVKVETVDSYQGEENDVIILSLVRSNPENQIGFLSIENRICVALSRARHGLYILGNMNCLTKKKSKMWSQISAELYRQHSIGSRLELRCQIHGSKYYVDRPEDFHSKAPDGGCTILCGSPLPNCDHHCSKYCHVVDPNHEEYKCKVKLPTLLQCGHIDKVDCYLVTGDLLDEVTCKIKCGVKLACGHVCAEKCNVLTNPELEHDHDTYLCRKKCMRSCELGHPCDTYHLCFQDCQPCEVLVSKKLPCGYVMENIECFTDISDLKAIHVSTLSSKSGSSIVNVCGALLTKCNHLCQSQNFLHSFDWNHDNYVCRIKVDVQLRCGHLLNVECDTVTNSEGNLKNVDCFVDCGARLDCGHFCPQKCHGKSHSKYSCLICRKGCKSSCKLGHPCSVEHPTWRDCPPCNTLVNKKLPCGHKLKNVKCFEIDSLEMLPCQVKCNMILPHCQHPCPQQCHSSHSSNANLKEIHQNEKCSVLVDVDLPCGHVKQHSCHEATFGAIDRVTCDSKCGAKLNCGHFCAANCHGIKDHRRKNCACREDCMRSCEHGHPCGSKHPCNQDCQPCKFPVTKNLPCGHEIQNVICSATSTDLETLPCKECTSTKLCDGALPNCKHRCPKLYHQKDQHHQKYKCVQFVTVKLNCGHEKQLHCHRASNGKLQDIDKVCHSKCGFQMSCRHVCIEKCHAGLKKGHKCKNEGCQRKCQRRCERGHPCSKTHPADEDCQPCQVQVEKMLPCGHKGMVSCDTNVTSVCRHAFKCKKPCNRMCPSGHECFTRHPCDEDCDPCQMPTSLVLPCGHVLTNKPCYVDDFMVFMHHASICERGPVPIPCRRPLPNCSHLCPEFNHMIHPDHHGYDCQEIVSAKMNCGHSTSIPCFQKTKEKWKSGPCGAKCGAKLDCGHLCVEKCRPGHTSSSRHSHLNCKSSCERKCKQGHRCNPPHPCNQDCPPCKSPVSVKLSCHPLQDCTAQCYQGTSDGQVKAIYANDLNLACKSDCGAILNCGHSCVEKCHGKSDPEHTSDKFKCKQDCTRCCVKGHPCSAGSAQLSQHPHPCFEKCSPCSSSVIAQLNCSSYPFHAKSVPCFMTSIDGRLLQIHDRDPLTTCEFQCSAELKCGHTCSGKCHVFKDADPVNDHDHPDHKCMNVCRRACDQGHPCPTIHCCFKDCEPCEVYVTKILACGHVLEDVLCSSDMLSLEASHTCDENARGCIIF